MIYGIGIDLVKVRRIAEALERWGERFQNKVFTPGEVRYCLQKKTPLSQFRRPFCRQRSLREGSGDRDPAGSALERC